jgi:hypothetical protein
MIKKREIICVILSITMANVLINLDGIYVSGVIGQSSEKDPASPNILKDPASPNILKFPLEIESGQEGDKLKNIENINNNNNVSICNKLKSFDIDLADTWIDGKITDEQVMYLGQQVKELIIKSGCIN